MGSLFKFTDVPVNYYTGVPDISIPLYEIKQGDISIPVSISYHAGGIKVSEKSSWVGLGWVLNTGASVSRNIMGLADEQSGGYFTAGTVKKESDYDRYSSTWLDYLWNTSQGITDGEPDIFQFNIGNKSASFIFNQASNYIPIITPYTPVKIARRGNLFFDITDDNGILYKFDKGEWTTNQNGGNNLVSAYSSWPVTQVISANKQDTVQYTYTSPSNPLTLQFDEINSISVSDNVTGAPDNHGNYPYTLDNGSGATVLNQQITTVNPLKLSTIAFANGEIIFGKNPSTRTDLANDNALQSVSIMALNAVSNMYVLVKKINFYQSYFITGTDNNTARLRLDSVIVQDRNGINVERYKFEYNSLMLPGYGSKMIDYWGYYNNKNNNILVPQMQIPFQTITELQTITIGSNIANGRDCDSAYMQACMLKKMYYPTGGYTEFQYETNQYKDDQNNVKLAGGLRIKTIKTYTGDGTSPMVKTYKYGDGYPFYSLKDIAFQAEQTNQNWNNPGGSNVWGTKRVRTFMANPSVSLSSYEGYTVGYPSVTEYEGDATSNNGKTDYNFNNVNDGIITLVPAMNKPEKFMYNMNRGQLILKTVYRRNADNSYSPVSSLSNQYGAFNDTLYPNIGFVSSKTTINDGNSQNIKCDPQLGHAGCYDAPENYIYTNFSFRAADNKLTGTTETTYDQGDPTKYLTRSTSYYYDNFSHQQTTRTVTTNSKGETSKVNLKYPGDFAGSLPYDTMVSRNIIDKVVQEKDSLNTSLLSIQKTNYTDAGNGNILPGSIDVQTGTGPMETRAYFQNYDTTGNILQMQKSDDVKTAFQWSHRYPVVQAINAQNTMVYTKSAAAKSGTLTYVPGNLQQQTASFTSYTVASISISLSFSGIPNNGTTSTFSYSLSGATTRSGTLCINRGGSCGSNLTNVTFTSMPAGSYTLSLTPSSNNSNVNVVATYSYTGFSIVSNGTKDFFYEGFENSAAVATATPCAGTRYYSGDYTVPFTRPTAGNYTIDYHYLAYGKWYAATKAFSDNMTLTDGDAIDEVRVYPETAQLSTYTYSPLVGMTSQCDAANRITYYEYDALGRLARIRDADKNILKQYSYKYNGQPASVNVPFCTSVYANYTNKKTVGYTVKMTNTANGNVVTFSIAAAPSTTTPNLDSESGVPPGVYTITITPSGGMPQVANFQVGTIFQTGTSFNAGGVQISCPTNLSIFIQ